jgi:hypothetical protein
MAKTPLQIHSFEELIFSRQISFFQNTKEKFCGKSLLCKGTRSNSYMISRTYFKVTWTELRKINFGRICQGNLVLYSKH